jgi:MFS family permease
VRDRLFANRWWIVVGSTLALTVGNGPIGLFSFGLFIKPLSTEFHWARGAISSAATAGHLCAAAASPVVGWMIDRWGIKRVMLPIITLYALALTSVGLFTNDQVSSFILLLAITGLISSGQAPLPYAKAIAAWFDRQRGLALGFAMAGIGIGVMFVPQVTRHFIETSGWRAGYFALAAMVFGIAFPSLALLVREPPAGARLARAGAGAAPGASVREALAGGPRFWIIAVAIFLVSSVVNGTFAHLVPLLTDRGFSATQAASLMGVVGFSTMAGRIVSGFLLDRFHAPRLASVIFLVPCAAVLLLASGTGSIAPLVAVIGLGFAAGCEVDMIGFLLSRYFGLRSFGQLYGYLFAVFSAGTGFGPLVLGYCFDLTRSYTFALLIFAAFSVIGSLTIGRLGPYVFPSLADRVPANAMTADAD